MIKVEIESFVKYCQSEDGKRGLAVDKEGYLWRGGKQEGSDQEAFWQWEQFDFNKEYQGYYPPCSFTAVAWTEGGFLAAGMETESARSRPAAYSSLRGSVWQPENLKALTADGVLTPTEPILVFCPDKSSGQIFLLGGRGQVITLTGCPNCVKISHFTDQDILKGEIAGEFLRLTLADGTLKDIHLHAALQLHLSREAAKEKQRQGGILVYVGTGEGVFEDFPEVLVCPLPRLNAFLQTCPKEQILVFLCESGVKAKAAAKSARAQGYEQAYYIGKNIISAEGRG